MTDKQMDSVHKSGFEIGHRITVEVESVFDDGIVVAFHGRDGTELMGALLQFPQCKNCCPQQPFIVSSNTGMANPLTYLHDHPYPKLKRYAKHLSRNIPPDVLLNWNTPPNTSAESSSETPLTDNLHSITKRHFGPASDVTESVLGDGYSVVAVRPSSSVDQATYDWPYALPFTGSGRQAKFAAQIKMRSDIAKLQQSDNMYIQGLQSEQRQRIEGNRKGHSFTNSSNFLSPPRKRKKTNDSVHDSGMSSDYESPLLKTGISVNTLTGGKFRLKNFSIPLNKITPAALAYTSNLSSPISTSSRSSLDREVQQ